jgi:hypothetical protein
VDQQVSDFVRRLQKAAPEFAPAIDEGETDEQVQSFVERYTDALNNPPPPEEQPPRVSFTGGIEPESDRIPGRPTQYLGPEATTEPPGRYDLTSPIKQPTFPGVPEGPRLPPPEGPKRHPESRWGGQVAGADTTPMRPVQAGPLKLNAFTADAVERLKDTVSRGYAATTVDNYKGMLQGLAERPESDRLEILENFKKDVVSERVPLEQLPGIIQQRTRLARNVTDQFMKIYAGTLGAIEGFLTWPAGMLLEYHEKADRIGTFPALVGIISSLPHEFTGIREISQYMRDGDYFRRRLREDPVGAMVPFLLLGGGVYGSRKWMERRAQAYPGEAKAVAGAVKLATPKPPTLEQMAENAWKEGRIGDAELADVVGEKRALEIRQEPNAPPFPIHMPDELAGSAALEFEAQNFIDPTGTGKWGITIAEHQAARGSAESLGRVIELAKNRIRANFEGGLRDKLTEQEVRALDATRGTPEFDQVMEGVKQRIRTEEFEKRSAVEATDQIREIDERRRELADEAKEITDQFQRNRGLTKDDVIALNERLDQVLMERYNLEAERSKLSPAAARQPQLDLLEPGERAHARRAADKRAGKIEDELVALKGKKGKAAAAQRKTLKAERDQIVKESEAERERRKADRRVQEAPPPGAVERRKAQDRRIERERKEVARDLVKEGKLKKTGPAAMDLEIERLQKEAAQLTEKKKPPEKKVSDAELFIEGLDTDLRNLRAQYKKARGGNRLTIQEIIDSREKERAQWVRQLEKEKKKAPKKPKRIPPEPDYLSPDQAAEIQKTRELTAAEKRALPYETTGHEGTEYASLLRGVKQEVASAEKWIARYSKRKGKVAAADLAKEKARLDRVRKELAALEEPGAETKMLVERMARLQIEAQKWKKIGQSPMFERAFTTKEKAHIRSIHDEIGRTHRRLEELSKAKLEAEGGMGEKAARIELIKRLGKPERVDTFQLGDLVISSEKGKGTSVWSVVDDGFMQRLRYNAEKNTWVVDRAAKEIPTPIKPEFGTHRVWRLGHTGGIKLAKEKKPVPPKKVPPKKKAKKKPPEEPVETRDERITQRWLKALQGEVALFEPGNWLDSVRQKALIKHLRKELNIMEVDADLASFVYKYVYEEPGINLAGVDRLFPGNKIQRAKLPAALDALKRAGAIEERLTPTGEVVAPQVSKAGTGGFYVRLKTGKKLMPRPKTKGPVEKPIFRGRSDKTAWFLTRKEDILKHLRDQRVGGSHPDHSLVYRTIERLAYHIEELRKAGGDPKLYFQRHKQKTLPPKELTRENIIAKVRRQGVTELGADQSITLLDQAGMIEQVGSEWRIRRKRIEKKGGNRTALKKAKGEEKKADTPTEKKARSKRTKDGIKAVDKARKKKRKKGDTSETTDRELFSGKPEADYQAKKADIMEKSGLERGTRAGEAEYSQYAKEYAEHFQDPLKNHPPDPPRNADKAILAEIRDLAADQGIKRTPEEMVDLAVGGVARDVTEGTAGYPGGGSRAPEGVFPQRKGAEPPVIPGMTKKTRFTKWWRRRWRKLHPDAPAVSPHMIRRMFEKKLFHPIRKLSKRQIGSGYLGKFWVRSEVSGVKSLVDLPTQFHEMGHWLDKVLGLKTGRARGKHNAQRKELLAAGKRLYGDKKPVGGYISEGVAEFIRTWLESPTRAMKDFPAYTREWTKRMTANPDIYEVMVDGHRMYRKMRDQPTGAYINSMISVGESRSSPWTMERLLNNVYNKIHTLKQVNREMTRTSGIEATSYYEAQTYRSVDATAREMLKHRMIDTKGNTVGPSLQEAVAPAKGRIGELRELLVAERGLELRKRGKESGMDHRILEKHLDWLKTQDFYPGLRKAADAVRKWNDQLLQYVVDGQVLSPELAKIIRDTNQAYVPWNRVMEGQFSGKVGTFGNMTTPVRRLRGDSRPIIDPFESMASNAFVYTARVKANRILLALKYEARRTDGAGRWVFEVPSNVKATKFKLEDFRKEIEAIGGDLSNVSDMDMQRFQYIFQPSSAVRQREPSGPERPISIPPSRSVT